MFTVGSTLSAAVICGLLPRIVRHHSLTRCTHSSVVVCASWTAVAAGASSWIVELTPGCSVAVCVTALLPAISWLWMPFMFTVTAVGLERLAVNWPFWSVTTVPIPGTLISRPGIGTLVPGVRHE